MFGEHTMETVKSVIQTSSGKSMAVAAAAMAAIAGTVIGWKRLATVRKERRVLDHMFDIYGPWAIVTGASSGFGAQFARSLAQRKLNVVLTARREDLLHQLSCDIEATYGVQTRVVAADLSTVEGVEKLVASLQDLDIGLIIANAGFGLSGPMSEQSTELLQQMVGLNCQCPVLLTSKMLPALQQRTASNRGRRAGIMFLGSIFSYVPVPYFCLYAATKAFNSFLAIGLQEELKEKRIDVIVCEPGIVSTGFQITAGVKGANIPNDRAAAQAADAMVRALCRGCVTFTPGFEHNIYAWIASCLPRLFGAQLVAKTSKYWKRH